MTKTKARNKKIYIPLWSYSNGIENLNIMPFKLFTFHYGPIQIISDYYNLICNNSIYIPLWSYSNRKNFNYKLLKKYIYIPLWSYSNGKNNTIPSDNTSFTFHYGPIQMKSHRVQRLRDPNLHSTMVLFKSI